VRAIELAYWFYVGWLVGGTVGALLRGGPRYAFMAVSHKVRGHLFMVASACVAILLSLMEWLVIRSEGDKEHG
jgi:hypothetical protein